jgi:hypothetical protein
MAHREPYASEEEFKKRVVYYPDVPLTELVRGSTRGKFARGR